jgi:hypothetical protein
LQLRAVRKQTMHHDDHQDHADREEDHNGVSVPSS